MPTHSHHPPGFHIDPYHGDENAELMADFFERCQRVGGGGRAHPLVSGSVVAGWKSCHKQATVCPNSPLKLLS